VIENPGDLVVTNNLFLGSSTIVLAATKQNVDVRDVIITGNVKHTGNTANASFVLDEVSGGRPLEEGGGRRSVAEEEGSVMLCPRIANRQSNTAIVRSAARRMERGLRHFQSRHRRPARGTLSLSLLSLPLSLSMSAPGASRASPTS